MVDDLGDVAAYQDDLLVAGCGVVAVNAGFAVELQVPDRGGEDVDGDFSFCPGVHD
jgi:hypothetical protein